MEKIRIGDACDILNGYAFKSDRYVDEGIRVIRIANVQKGYIEDIERQEKFYWRKIRNADNKVYVIISDALR